MEQQESPRRYRAFISYSHHDVRAAKWLQRALESYRVPKYLVGRKTARGQIPARLGKIFLDRSDLSVAADLEQQLDQQLGQAQSLIVVCSPGAAKSRWVQEEILYFRRLHGENAPIFALIIDGEPFAAASSQPELECLPAALRFRLDANGQLSDQPAEPLAADLRTQGDGKRMALLKLVAAMLGLQLDELVRRDHQLRVRNLRVLSAAAMLAVVVLSSLSYAAIKARNLAEQQRHAAEGLVNLMLTDLREKLEPIGRLDVLDVVGEGILEYYAAQDDASLQDDALGRQASAMHMLGQMRQEAGDVDQAIQLFAMAAQKTGEMLKRAPDDPQRIYDHAQSVFWVGYPDYERGDYEKARHWFDQYLALARQLVTADPDNVSWQLELSYALAAQAVLYFEYRKLENSLALFEEAAGLLAAMPDNQEARQERINNLGWIASVQLARGQYSRAIAARLKQFDAIEQWREEEPKRDDLRRDLLTTEHQLAGLYHLVGEAELGDRFYRRAMNTARQLTQQDPDNKEYRAQVYKVRLERILFSGKGLSDGAALLGDIRTLANALPDNNEVQVLRWWAELRLMLLAGRGIADYRERETAGEILNWVADRQEVRPGGYVAALRVLANLVMAADPAADPQQKLAYLKESQKALESIADPARYALQCSSETGAVFLAKARLGLESIEQRIERCLGVVHGDVEMAKEN
ncbi:toll/interleukin-1 receptor domain-containing protein [Biformimicrobium ophioploci]|uniref:TIR domain-containing protein n=1 Tax=Biformimicrobium ophioploci TaxID=3036711 RepID=A0ABQ6LWC9_9GAMM|nr:toll/interleukin-1 receptor domain-containing protein [Microbulbifer sp. NKW57]GMG86361.1 TIR domain-containing protein [Microbulbifer sp. NKW57]